MVLSGGAEMLEVISEEGCYPVLKPMPMMTGRDGQHYTPLQAMGHVLGLQKQTVDTTVGAIRTAASVVADKAQAAQVSLTAALEGEMLCSALPCPTLPCPALPCPALPCPALPCPALC